MNSKPKLLAIAGSLRKNSYNCQLLESLKSAGQAHIELVMFKELSTIPLFNEDLKPIAMRPQSVIELCKLIENVDGVVIATPEYCQSVPGVLKNVLDWISVSKALDEKPVAILGGTTGVWGTRYAQASLRHTLISIGSYTMQRPMVFVNDIKNQLPGEKRPIDPALESRLETFAQSIAIWTTQHSDQNQ